MNRILALVGLGILGATLLVGTGNTGEPKKDKEGKTKGMLPQGWKDLKLTAEQKAAVYKIQGEFKGKIVDLEKKIAELRSQQRSEMVKVLTTEQKAALIKYEVGDDAKDKDKTKDKDKAKDKDK